MLVLVDPKGEVLTQKGREVIDLKYGHYAESRVGSFAV